MIYKPTFVEKPWGREIWLANEPEYALKLIEVGEGGRLSLQYHKKKKESVYVFKGKMRLLLGDNELLVEAGEAVHIQPNVKHRMEALEDLILIEVSTPQLDDVVRLEDDYGRV